MSRFGNLSSKALPIVFLLGCLVFARCLDTTEFDRLAVPPVLEVPPAGEDLLALNMAIYELAKFAWYWTPSQNSSGTLTIKGLTAGTEAFFDGYLYFYDQDLGPSEDARVFTGLYGDLSTSNWQDATFATHQEECYFTRNLVIEELDVNINSEVSSPSYSGRCTNNDYDLFDCENEGYIYHTDAYTGQSSVLVLTTGTMNFRFLYENDYSDESPVSNGSLIGTSDFASESGVFLHYDMVFEKVFFQFTNLFNPDGSTSLLWAYSGTLFINGQKYRLNTANQLNIDTGDSGYCEALKLYQESQEGSAEQ